MIETRVAHEALAGLPPAVRTVAITGGAASPPEEELDAMAAHLDEGWDAVVCRRPVSEAVKVVEAGWVTGSLDRSGLVSTVPPLLIDREVLSGILTTSATGGWVDLIEAVVATGGKVGIRP